MGSKSGNVQGGSNDPEAKNFPFSKEGDSSLKQETSGVRLIKIMPNTGSKD